MFLARALTLFVVCLAALAAVMKALGRYGKLLEDGTRKAADTTGNIWHHRKFPHTLSDPLHPISSSPADRH